MADKDKLEERIEELEDDRFGKVCAQVDSIHKILVGNGDKGLIQKVEQNTTNIKIILGIIMLVVGALVTCAFKDIVITKEPCNTKIEKIVEK